MINIDLDNTDKEIINAINTMKELGYSDEKIQKKYDEQIKIDKSKANKVVENMGIDEAISQLEFDKGMILFEPSTGKTLTPEEVKLYNEQNYKTYLADCRAIEALKFKQEHQEDLMRLDAFVQSRGKELIEMRKEMDKCYQEKLQKFIDKINEEKARRIVMIGNNGYDYAIKIINEELGVRNGKSNQ